MNQAQKGMVKAPVAMTKKRRPQGRPKITHNPDGSCRIQYKEFVVDVTATPEELTREDGSKHFGASPFEALEFAINPGLADLFPWFHIMAKGFEMYHVNKIGMEFDPSCPTTTQGTVMLATDYDAHDDPPIDKVEMMAMKGAQRTAPWECARCETTSKDIAHAKDYYIRDVPPSVEQDITLLDVGKFILSTANILSGLLGENTGDDITLGELYVDYDITLKNPTMERASAAPGTAMRIAWIPDTLNSADIPFGNDPNIIQNSSTPVFDYNDTTGEFTCNVPGEYLFLMRITSEYGNEANSPGISHNFVFDPVSGTPVYTFLTDVYINPLTAVRGGFLECGWWFIAKLGDKFIPKVNGAAFDTTNGSVQGIITPIDYDLMNGFTLRPPVPSPHNLPFRPRFRKTRTGRRLMGVQPVRLTKRRRRMR